MTSRERVRMAIRHQEPDRVPIDLGGSVTTGIHAAALHRLRIALGLPQTPVKVYEPMMFLGLVESDVCEALRLDVVGLNSPTTLLGYRNEGWKPWTLPDGTPVQIGSGFATTTSSDGSIYAYPEGDLSARPSAKMPAGGLYFDNIVRQDDLTNHSFDARHDYKDQYNLFTDEDLRWFEQESIRLFRETDCSVFGNFFLGGVGDIFHIPAAWLKNPKGIRDLEEWMIAPFTHPEYVREFFDMQLEIELKNLELYRDAVGDRIDVIAISGTDFGAQNSLLISPACYNGFYKPYHKRFCDWVHKNTDWKVFFHTCGSIVGIIDDLIEAGVDILNPVQIGAAGMDPRFLKERYGDKLVFWGGSVDPQRTMPFGSAKEVESEARANSAIFAPGGGYIRANVHNIQANTPVENILALFRT